MSGSDSERPDAAVEQEPAPASADPADLLAEAEARADGHRAEFLRALAELENVRKRSAREVDSARQFGVERFAADLLPVADSLDLALQSATTADVAALAQGQEATLRLLHKAFERAGLEVVDPGGQAFDPALHEAMAMQPAPDRPAHTVLQVVQKGWLLNGRLLRPARVIVSAPAAEPPGEPAGG